MIADLFADGPNGTRVCRGCGITADESRTSATAARLRHANSCKHTQLHTALHKMMSRELDAIADVVLLLLGDNSQQPEPAVEAVPAAVEAVLTGTVLAVGEPIKVNANCSYPRGIATAKRLDNGDIFIDSIGYYEDEVTLTADILAKLGYQRIKDNTK